MASSTQNATVNGSPPSVSNINAKRYVDNNMDSSSLEKIIEETVQYILFCCLSQKNVLVRRADINKNVLKEHARGFLIIFEQARDRLKTIFGLEVVELDEKQDRFGIKNQFQFDISMRSAAFVNSSDTLNEINKAEEIDLCAKYSFLIITLTIIFMNGNEIESTQLWECLKSIDLNRTEKRNPFIGDVEKYFTNELVKEGYLEYEKDGRTDPPTFKFKWGYRAQLEVSKKSLLNFVCEVYGGLDIIKPSDWQSQFADAQKDNEPQDMQDVETLNAFETSQAQTQIQTQGRNSTRIKKDR
jgi:hypothetical protein